MWLSNKCVEFSFLFIFVYEGTARSLEWKKRFQNLVSCAFLRDVINLLGLLVWRYHARLAEAFMVRSTIGVELL